MRATRWWRTFVCGSTPGSKNLLPERNRQRQDRLWWTRWDFWLGLHEPAVEMIRSGADRARVSGIFEISPTPALVKLLEEAGFVLEDNELLVEREILANGKSRAFVANRPATVAFLKDLAPHLGDIHGQHDQQQLFRTPCSGKCWTCSRDRPWNLLRPCTIAGSLCKRNSKSSTARSQEKLRPDGPGGRYRPRKSRR